MLGYLWIALGGALGSVARFALNGTAAQTHVNSRWGDYTDMTVDPVDDCTFWYVNEYYTVEGAATAPLGNGWQTRIASFKLPGC